MGGAVAPTDLWWNVKELPWVGNFRIGNFKQPIGLEHANSSRFLDFMERTFQQDLFWGPFNNGFSPGAMFYNWNEEQTATWALGVFKNISNIFAWEGGSRNNVMTGRLTWTPWFDEPSHGRYMVHVGLGASYGGLPDGFLRVRARESLRNGPSQLWPNLADTGFVAGTSQTLVSPEFAVVYGPWLFQAEWTGSFLSNSRVLGIAGSENATGVGSNTDLGTAFYQGGYAEVLCFLTGEHREYERKAAAFGRVVPHENFYWTRGGGLTTGAWQLGFRYNFLNLNPPGIPQIRGGTAQDYTIGLNHFLNPNMKLQYNFVVTDRSIPFRQAAGGNVGGLIYGFGMRVAHDF